MMKAVRRVLRGIIGKSQEQIKEEVHKQPEVVMADQALKRFYESVRSSERGAIYFGPERREINR